MAWSIEFDSAAKKDLAKLDRQIARRITAFMRERVARLDDPRSIGEALKGSELGEFWKYRVDHYRRVTCELGCIRALKCLFFFAGDASGKPEGLPWRQFRSTPAYLHFHAETC